MHVHKGLLIVLMDNCVVSLQPFCNLHFYIPGCVKELILIILPREFYIEHHLNFRSMTDGAQLVSVCPT